MFRVCEPDCLLVGFEGWRLGSGHQGQGSDIASFRIGRSTYVVSKGGGGGYAACKWQNGAMNDSLSHDIAITDGTAPDTSSPPARRRPPCPDAARCLYMWSPSLPPFHRQRWRSERPMRWRRGRPCSLPTTCVSYRSRRRRGGLPRRHGIHGSPSPPPHPPRIDKPSCLCSSSAHA